MITIVIVTYLSGLFNGVMDGIQFLNYWLNKYAWFEPELSSINKWEYTKEFIEVKTSDPGTIADSRVINNVRYYLYIEQKRRWYYLWIYKPKYVEAFPYSSTFLVFLTQGWHLAKLFTFDLLLGIMTFLVIDNSKVSYEGWVIPDVWYSYPIVFFSLKIIIGLGFTTSYR